MNSGFLKLFLRWYMTVYDESFRKGIIAQQHCQGIRQTFRNRSRELGYNKATVVLDHYGTYKSYIYSLYNTVIPFAALFFENENICTIFSLNLLVSMFCPLLSLMIVSFTVSTFTSFHADVVFIVNAKRTR